MKRQRAVITVFFCLLSVVFLAFCFTILEAVRFSGARAQCRNVTSLGLWSVFSEYDNILLEDYGLFAVDAAYGGDLISKEKIKGKLTGYIEENGKPASDLVSSLPGLLLDPWKVSSRDTSINQYALLTDRGGEYYYQQAVEYMAKTAWSDAIGKLKDAYQDAQGVRQAESEFENGRKEADKESRKEASGIKEAKKEQTTYTITEDDGSETLVTDQNAVKEVEKAQKKGKKHDPREKMAQLKSGNLLKLTCGNIKLSQKSISSKDLLSKRRGNKGVLNLDTPRGGMVDDLLFREYLLDHFRSFKDGPGDEALLYQAEYLIGGKYKDQDNLKKTVRSLLFLREGFNYMFLVTNPAKNKEASALAALILGWTGKPLLIAALKHALLLEWAYAESLFDARILLHGGRIPLKKSAGSWHVPLKALMKMKKYLTKADKAAASGTTGLQYEDYLRLLLNLTGMSKLKKRSLDMIDLNMRTVCGCPSFRADNCIIGITVKTNWTIPSIFGKVPAALLGTGDLSTDLFVEGGFAYR